MKSHDRRIYPATEPHGIGQILQSANYPKNTGIPRAQLRRLDCFALVYVYAGSGHYDDENGNHHQVTAGDMLILFPGLGHHYGSAETWDEMYTMFRGPQFDLLLNSGILNTKRPVWRLEPIAYWLPRLRDAISITIDEDLSAPHRLGRLVSFILEAADAQDRTHSPEHAWLERARREIGARLTGQIDFKAIARLMGVSYETFRKRFTRLADESPGRYRDRLLHERGANLLRQTSMSVGEIADELGFCDAFHFSKQFKKHTGMSPREFRNRFLGSAATTRR